MTYFRPNDMGSALSWLAENHASGAVIAAGCTDLFPATTAPALSGPVLDITAIESLRGIEKERDHWRFGGATTWTDVINAPLPPAFEGLKLASREVGSVQIQNAATLAGNLCNASPAADGVPCWLTLDASVELASVAGPRTLPLSEFLLGPRKTALKAGEILSAILVPKAAACGRSTFVKLGARKYLVISIAMVAVRLVSEAGVVREAAISVGACGAVATRLKRAEAALVGVPVGPELMAPLDDDMLLDGLSPIDDVRGDAGYRLRAANALVRRAISQLASEGNA